MQRCPPLLLAAVLIGCAHAGTRAERKTDIDFSAYRSIGVLPFTDAKGRGLSIAQALRDGLRQLSYESPEVKRLESALSMHKPDKELGLSLEALADLRAKTSVDALIFGNTAADWKEASMLVVETETGDKILQAVIKPGKDKKSFTAPDEIAREILYIFAALAPSE